MLGLLRRLEWPLDVDVSSNELLVGRQGSHMVGMIGAVGFKTSKGFMERLNLGIQAFVVVYADGDACQWRSVAK